MKISLRRLVFLGVGLLAATYVLAAERSSQEQALIASGDYHPEAGDKIVLFQSKPELIPERNFGNLENPEGHCLGNQLVQMGLWSAVKFENGEPDSDGVITQKLIRASNPKKFEPQVIRGFSSMVDFLNRMNAKGSASPVKRAIEQLQSEHSVLITSTGLQINSSPAPRGRGGLMIPQGLVGKLQEPIDLSRILQQKIIQKVPVSLGVFKASEESGHALMVIGYIDNPKDIPSRRYIVADSNYPNKWMILKRESKSGREVWTYPIQVGLAKGGPSERVEVAVASITQETKVQEARERMIRSSNSSPRTPSNIRICESSGFGREVASILGAATHPE